MSNSYAAASALIFAVVALAHLVRLINRWAVQIGPYKVSTNVSWAALIVSALIAIWGFMQLPH
jgi:hypothetical protein